MKLPFFILIGLWAYSALGQDIIVKKNGDEIKSKVLEVTISEVKFKNVDNPDGPIYTLSKSDIFMIKYENGLKEMMNANETNQSSPSNNTQSSGFQEINTYSAPIPIATISRIENAGGKYFQNGLRLSDSKVYRLLRESPYEQVKNSSLEAVKLDKTATPLIVIAIPFMSAGFVIGALSTLVISSIDNSSNSALRNSNKAQIEEVRSIYGTIQGIGFTMAGLGTASLIAGITLKSSASKKLQIAVNMYNSSIK